MYFVVILSENQNLSGKLAVKKIIGKRKVVGKGVVRIRSETWRHPTMWHSYLGQLAV